MVRTDDRVDSQIAGIPISIRGLNMVVFLALVAVTSYTIYYLSVIVSREHLALSSAVDKLAEVQKEQNYILLADNQETARIRSAYRMPQSLREKLNGTQP